MPSKPRVLDRGATGRNTGAATTPAALASAAAGLLAPFYFVEESAAWFIPAGRFSGLLISAVAGARLGRRSG